MNWKEILKDDPYRENDIKRIMAEKGVSQEEALRIYAKNVQGVKDYQPTKDEPKTSFGWNLSMFTGKSWNKKLEQLLKQQGLGEITNSAIEDAGQAAIDILLALSGEDSSFESDGQEYMAEQVGHIFNEIVQDLATSIHNSIDKDMFEEEEEEELEEILEDKHLDDQEINYIWEKYGVGAICTKSIESIIKKIADLMVTNSGGEALSSAELSKVKNEILESNALKSFSAHAYILLATKIYAGMHTHSGSENERKFGDMLTPEEEKWIEDNTEEHDMGPFKVSSVSGIDPRTGIPETDVVMDREAQREYLEESDRENKSFAKAWGIIKGNCRRCKDRKHGILYSYW
tara:strand:- start:104 stop:1138 length:1035 start_codon:yes stop_codon:yes gene_type:complete